MTMLEPLGTAGSCMGTRRLVPERPAREVTGAGYLLVGEARVARGGKGASAVAGHTAGENETAAGFLGGWACRELV